MGFRSEMTPDSPHAGVGRGDARTVPEALAFDIYGAVVDRRTGIAPRFGRGPARPPGRGACDKIHVSSAIISATVN